MTFVGYGPNILNFIKIRGSIKSNEFVFIEFPFLWATQSRWGTPNSELIKCCGNSNSLDMVSNIFDFNLFDIFFTTKLEFWAFLSRFCWTNFSKFKILTCFWRGKHNFNISNLTIACACLNLLYFHIWCHFSLDQVYVSLIRVNICSFNSIATPSDATIHWLCTNTDCSWE